MDTLLFNRYLTIKNLSNKVLTCSSSVCMDLDHTTRIGNNAVKEVKTKLTTRKII